MNRIKRRYQGLECIFPEMISFPSWTQGEDSVDIEHEEGHTLFADGVSLLEETKATTIERKDVDTHTSGDRQGSQLARRVASVFCPCFLIFWWNHRWRFRSMTGRLNWTGTAGTRRTRTRTQQNLWHPSWNWETHDHTSVDARGFQRLRPDPRTPRPLLTEVTANVLHWSVWDKQKQQQQCAAIYKWLNSIATRSFCLQPHSTTVEHLASRLSGWDEPRNKSGGKAKANLWRQGWGKKNWWPRSSWCNQDKYYYSFYVPVGLRLSNYLPMYK